jgi:hypothetical protein
MGLSGRGLSATAAQRERDLERASGKAAKRESGQLGRDKRDRAKRDSAKRESGKVAEGK